MPIYEFQCNDCNYVFEELFSTTENQDNVVCTKCKSSNVRKLMSASAVFTASENVPMPSCGNACCSQMDCPAMKGK